MTVEELNSQRPAGTKSHRGRQWVVFGIVMVVVLGAIFALWWYGLIPARQQNQSAASSQEAPAPAATTVPVKQETLSATTSVDATLGYAGDYQVLGRSAQGGGTVTWLPDVGDVIKEGKPLYRVDGTPVPLLYGKMPAYRSLQIGDRGRDVHQLNEDLVALGYDDGGQLQADSHEYDDSTAAAVQAWQDDLGVDATGKLSLGSFVFLPTSLRVTNVAAEVGGPLGQSPVLTGTSTSHQVDVPLDVSLQSDVKTGDKVTITLPDGSTTSGDVTDVGTVATGTDSSSGSSDSSGSADSGSSGGDSGATIQVLVTPDQPDKLGRLDQAPVQVAIVTGRTPNALVVPLAALLARPGGSYAVEVVDGDNHHHLVTVDMGLVDDTDELVAVTGNGLKAGQNVVVPEA